MNLELYTKFKIYFLHLFSFKNRKFYKFLLNNIKFSKSQVYQDLFVIYYSKLKKGGTFIEIGGGNGKTISNTYLHEKKYKWKGIICEPVRKSQKQIRSIRKATLEIRPVGKVSKKNTFFFENDDPYQSSLKASKNSLKKYIIDTISLNSLIRYHKLDKNIDYISIDTEGNEIDIIKSFNFKKYKVRFFTIEHNFNDFKRKKIFEIMSKNKFKRVYTHLSYMDDWYISREIHI
jgi:FkbM family methyltransferase